MGSAFKCSICGKICYHKSSQIAALGEHLLSCHPNVPLTHFSFENKVSKKCVCVCTSTKKCTCDREKFKLVNPEFSKFEAPSMYQTTVETWKPGLSPLQCTACKRTGQPLVRKQQNKVAQSSLGALCLLGCWPLCFLPFILGGSNVMNLYCKHCGMNLGTYDRKTGQLVPSCPEDVVCDCS